MGLVKAKLPGLDQNYSWIFCAHLLSPLYWRNWQKVLIRAREWATKPMRQSEDNRKATLTTSRESHRMPVGLLGLSACSKGSVDVRFLDYESSLSWQKTGFQFEYLSEHLYGNCLDTCLSVYKRMCLDDQYFLVIFQLKLRKNQNSCYQKQDEK